MALGDSGLLAIDDGTPTTVLGNPFSFGNFAPLFSAGRGIFSALQGDAGGALAGGLGALAGIIGGPAGIALGAGGLLAGGLSSRFGSGENRSIVIPPLVQDFLNQRNLFIPNAGGAVENSNRDAARILASQIQRISPIIQEQANVFNRLGFSDLADDLLEQDRQLSRTPANQADGVAINQSKVNLIEQAFKLRESIFATALSSPEFTTQFEASNNVSLNDFINEVQRQDQVFAQGFELNEAQDTLQREQGIANRPTGRLGGGSSERDSFVSNQPNIQGFQEVRGGQPNRNRPRDIVAFERIVPGSNVGRGNRGQREQISVAEFNARQNAAGQLFDEQTFGDRNRQIAGFESFINAPGLDISGAQSGFGDLFNDFLLDAGDVPVNTNPLLGIQPPADTQPPIDGGGTGSTSDPFDQDAEDFFAQQQRESDLITAQERSRAIQDDENATQDERDAARREFNLAFAGFLSTTLESGQDVNINPRRPDINISPDLSFRGLLAGQSPSVSDRKGLFAGTDVFKPIRPVTTKPKEEIKRAPVVSSGFPIQSAGLLAGIN